MAKLINGVRVVTNKVRLSYAHVAQPSSGMAAMRQLSFYMIQYLIHCHSL